MRLALALVLAPLALAAGPSGALALLGAPRDAPVPGVGVVRSVGVGEISECVGTLVAPGWVLTAAHCPARGWFAPLSALRARSAISQVQRAPGGRDLALLAVTGGSEQSYMPVAEHARACQEHESAQVSGRAHRTPEQPDYLPATMRAQLVRPCGASELMFVGPSEAPGARVCSGDSGSPVLVRDPLTGALGVRAVVSAVFPERAGEACGQREHALALVADLADPEVRGWLSQVTAAAPPLPPAWGARVLGRAGRWVHLRVRGAVVPPPGARVRVRSARGEVVGQARVHADGRMRLRLTAGRYRFEVPGAVPWRSRWVRIPPRDQLTARFASFAD